MDEAEVGLEMARIFRIAVHETDAHEVRALALLAQFPFAPSEWLGDLEAHARRTIATALALRRGDDERHAAAQGKRSGLRKPRIERHHARLDQLHHHVDS